MIEILIEHSEKENYSVIAEILVHEKNPAEKQRIQDLIDANELQDAFIERTGNDEELIQSLADILKVSPESIELDTFEIDGIADEEQELK